MLNFFVNFSFCYCSVLYNSNILIEKERKNMKLSIKHTKNNTFFYMVKSIRINGKSTSRIIECLGKLEEVKVKANGEDPIEWAKKYVYQKTLEEKENKATYYTKLVEGSPLTNQKIFFNTGYLFLKKIYKELKLDKICKQISKKYKFEYDLDSILSRLIYTRILEPSSKLSSFESSKNFLEQPNFEPQHIYRALEVIANETEFIEAEVYKNSLSVVNRNTKILYYDCTNYFFETEQAEGLKQYGVSKENRPTPIVQMGLFMDGNGYPLAFCINPGNTNEQVTLKPLEKRIIEDFELSHFIVCTDAGLASKENRAFNNLQNRSYIVTQSLKKIKGHLKEWAFSTDGWHTINSNTTINLEDIDNSSSNETVYYKERWIKENGMEQRLIVSYSPKYAAYQKNIRNGQVIRAENMIEKPSSVTKKKINDPKRFISSTYITGDGEIADSKKLTLNIEAINEEAMFDGFYAVCTTLEDDIEEIIKVNKRRWEIEESFRILKTEFKSRPVYLKNDDRIKAHFTTCFLSLLIYRILENKLDYKFSISKIISTLQSMNSLKIDGLGYKQIFESSTIVNALCDLLDVQLNTDFISNKNMKKIINKL